jgi:hypothetical protein
METRKTKNTAPSPFFAYYSPDSSLSDGGDVRERLAASFKRARFATDRRVS